MSTMTNQHLPIILLLCLCIALPVVPAAAGLDIEAAPLNPDFVRYMDEQEAAPPAVPLFLAAAPAPEPSENEYPVYPNSLIPAPGTPLWPDGSASVVATAEPPAEPYFNLADEGRVTTVKNQGKCGACWTFGALGSLESALLNDGLGEWDLSENNMKNTHGFDAGPCDGGNAFMATAYLTRGSGPVNESDDPYLLPVPSPESPTGLSPVMQVQNVTFLPPRDGPLDNDLIKTTIKEEGGLYAGFLVNYSLFGPNAATYYLPENSTAKLDGSHAVLLVGWDDAYPAANFVETPPGDGAFIARNSWGTSSGDDGYFSISYYDRSIGRFQNPATEYIGTGRATAAVLFTGEPADSYDHLYQYDPLGWTTSIGTGVSTTMYGKNLFTAERYEFLEAVSFFTREPGTAYEVRVALIEGDTSRQVYAANGTMALPGYRTLPLDAPVPLVPGREFSVTLRVTAPADTHPLVVEMPVAGYSSGAAARSGESFISLDGGDWDDLTAFFPDTNLCIKAFTRDPVSVPGDYATIREAVAAATPGDVILLGSGVYNENVVIDRPLTLIGNGDPVVDGDGGDVLTLTGSNITVRGITLTDGADGILVVGNDVTLADLTVTDCSENGIAVTSSASFTLTNCTAVGNAGAGLNFDDVRNGTLSRNTMAGNQWNLRFVPAAGYESSIAMDETNTVDGRPVYVWTGRHDEAVPGDAGMVYLIECRNITAEDLALSGNYVGLVVSDSTGVTVRNVTATGNFAGAFCRGSDALSISDSAFVGNAYSGFSSLNCTATTVTGSRIADNTVGAFLAAADPTDTVLWQNTFANNTGGHLSLEGQVALDSTTPLPYRYNGTYFMQRLGNFWDDYAGTDTDGDGIGETPYAVPGLNDTAPLVVPSDHYGVGEVPPPTPTPTPTPVPPAPAPAGGGGGGGGGGGHRAPSPPPMPFPMEPAAPLHEASYEVKSQSAVSAVDLTAAADLAGVRVTAEKKALPSDIVPPAAAVYEYDEITLSHIADADLRGALISFAVPLAWIEAQGAGTQDILLLRYRDGAWVPLKTRFVKEENGEARYVAETPGFSYFAIAVAERPQGEESPATPAVVEEAPAGTPPSDAPPNPHPTPVGLIIPCLAAGIAALLLVRRR
ncbi:lectin like domain-containing protein [Methanofollis formosanus]|nr:lectin like domain-containing protein [Methanofollis formosanus]